MVIKIIICHLLIYFALKAKDSNHLITFKVVADSMNDTTSIFLTGNHSHLGNWIPDQIKLINQNNHTWTTELSFPKDTLLEYKFTRGSWDTEALRNDDDVPRNYKLKVDNDTTVEIKIDKWKDIYLNSDQREINADIELHQKLDYPGLKQRDVIVWLPPGYETNPGKKYPVLYMHDGQNLFDPNTSFGGIDWQIDETTYSLIKNNDINPIIIVDIYNTSDRNAEYSDTSFGKKYAGFLINKLKPFIDENYRTLSDAENTAVGGSSLGGLISFIMVWEYPYIFSKAICMSPAFKIDDIDYVAKVKSYNGSKKKIKVYIDNGGLDIEKQLQPGIDEMLIVLKDKGYLPDIEFLWFKDKSARHNESAWATRFWRPLIFLFKK